MMYVRDMTADEFKLHSEWLERWFKHISINSNRKHRKYHRMSIKKPVTREKLIQIFNGNYQP